MQMNLLAGKMRPQMSAVFDRTTSDERRTTTGSNNEQARFMIDIRGCCFAHSARSFCCFRDPSCALPNEAHN